MAKGGYQVIDLSKDPFISGTPHTVNGAFKKATRANNLKPILLEGINLISSSFAPIASKNAEWVNFSGNASEVSATLSDNTTVAITSTDAVTVTVS